MDAEEARAIGFALWRVRDNRRKGLRLVAELSGMSKDTLNRIERGLLSPTLAQLHALAEVLQISPQDLTRLPVPAPANGHTDSTTEAIGLAIDAIECGEAGGLVVPVAALREQVHYLHRQRRACRFAEVADALPALIRNVHATLDNGGDRGELLDLAVYLHVHLTRLWLLHAGAPGHLLRRVAFLARRLAQERGDVAVLGMAAVAVVDALGRGGGGALELAQAELNAVTLPPATADNAGLIGVLTSTHATIATRARRPGDVVAPVDAAAELATRFGITGRAGPLGFLYGPVNDGMVRAWVALETGEPDRAVSLAQDINPDRHPYPISRAHYWTARGRALAQLGGRNEDAVRALRTAEGIFPTMVLRDASVRDTLVVLLRQSPRRPATDQELRGMARRAGLLT